MGIFTGEFYSRALFPAIIGPHQKTEDWEEKTGKRKTRRIISLTYWHHFPSLHFLLSAPSSGF
jgi:hypothetical protein